MSNSTRSGKPVILDASAVLALFFREPGSDVVAENIQHGAVLSSVNLSEVISKQLEVGIPPEETMSMIQLLGIRIHDFTPEAAVLTGLLRNPTKSKGLSLGDRACLALAQQLAGTVVTGDSLWGQLKPDLHIVVIR